MTATIRRVIAAGLCGIGAGATGPGRASASNDAPEPYRLAYHFTPPRHFMNDPNGLVFYRGEYHLFYQHNPEGNVWGHMSWGHAVSRDLVHWTHLPVALHEEKGVLIFSGSAVVDRRNTSGLCTTGDGACLIAIYTGHGHGKQTQNLAVSQDGRTFVKYAGNPVLDIGSAEFRDPKVFWHEPTRRWVMVVALPVERKIQLYVSANLRTWELASEFGPAGSQVGLWECPDLFELPVDGDPSHRLWVLDVDVSDGAPAGRSGGQYFVGSFDGRTFTNANPPETTLWVDYGKDFYASASFSDIPPDDGRRLWMGWMSNWAYANEEPTATWRGALTVARSLALRTTPSGVRLTQWPVAELRALRGAPRTFERVDLSGRAAVEGVGGRAFEMEVELRPGHNGTAGLVLADTAGHETILGYDSEVHQLFLDRTRSGDVAFSPHFPGRHVAPLALPEDGILHLTVLVDVSSVEVFADGGLAVITDRIFPTSPLTVHAFAETAPAPLIKLTAWPLE